jgi:Protein of unknown function (DUF4242)
MTSAQELKLYVIRRASGWRTPEELQEAAAKSASVGDEEMSDDIRWIRSYVVKESDGGLGTVCIYLASSLEKVREHAARAGLPAHRVSAVRSVIDPLTASTPPRTSASISAPNRTFS